jgi:hypothetical protein
LGSLLLAIEDHALPESSPHRVRDRIRERSVKAQVESPATPSGASLPVTLE